jgi:hypothetical protein
METDTLRTVKKIIVRSKIVLPEERPEVKRPEVKKSFSRKLNEYLNKEDQDPNRFKWIITSMILQAVLITPIVGIVIYATGNYLFFWALCAAAMYLTFVPSIAGLRVKNVLSTFLISTVINIAIVFAAIGMYIFF